MSKGDSQDPETPTGFIRREDGKLKRKTWWQRPEYFVPLFYCFLTGGGLLTVFGNHISDAWSCGAMIEKNKENLDQIKTIVWQDHLNIIRIGDKVGLQLDPPKEELFIKQVLSTNMP